MRNHALMQTVAMRTRVAMKQATVKVTMAIVDTVLVLTITAVTIVVAPLPMAMAQAVTVTARHSVLVLVAEILQAVLMWVRK